MKINSNSVRKLIALHIFVVLIILFFWSVFGLPWEIIYIFDIFVCIELFWILFLGNIQTVFRRTNLSHLLLFFVAYTLYLVLNQLINVVPPILAVQAFRRTFRFYMFFLACAVLLTENGIEKIMKMLLMMQVLNFLLTLYQYFVQGISQDYLGGIFGIEKGANAYSNVFLCLICTYMIVKYLAKQIKLLPMILTIGSALLIAALAELKIFFIEIVAIVLMGVLFSNPSARTIKTIVFAAAGFAVAITLFGSIFPEHLAILLDFALFTQYTTEVIHGYNISRLNAFSEINHIFFRDNVFRNLFGFGFGNCESGSAFYDKYSGYHYTWFSHQVTFLETGYVGIIFYITFFALIFIFATKSKKVNPENAFYYTFAQIITVLCVIWLVYNQALHSEVAYLVFFALAIPVAIRNNWVKSLYSGNH